MKLVKDSIEFILAITIIIFLNINISFADPTIWKANDVIEDSDLVIVGKVISKSSAIGEIKIESILKGSYNSKIIKIKKKVSPLYGSQFIPEKGSRIIVCLEYIDGEYSLQDDIAPLAIIDEKGNVKQIYGGYVEWYPEDKKAFESFYKMHYTNDNIKIFCAALLGVSLIGSFIIIFRPRKSIEHQGTV